MNQEIINTTCVTENIFPVSNNTFNNIDIAASPNAKPLLFAFGTLDNISYSGDLYTLDGNNLKIPYPGQALGGVDTVYIDYLGFPGNPFVNVNIS